MTPHTLSPVSIHKSCPRPPPRRLPTRRLVRITHIRRQHRPRLFRTPQRPQRLIQIARLTRLYGPADRYVVTRQGSYHVYDRDGILVLTRADTVRSWTAFALQ